MEQAAVPVAAVPVAVAQRVVREDALPSSKAALVSNANASEVQEVNALLERLQNALRARDANALGFFGLAPATSNTPPRFRMTHLTVAPDGALARLVYDNGGAAGVTELWLARSGSKDGGAKDFVLSDRHWTAPFDAPSKLNEAAADAWNKLPASSRATGALIDLIAERRGGRWIPLRASNIWTGAVLDATQLAQTAAQMESEGGALPSTSEPVASSSRRASLNSAHFASTPGDVAFTRYALPTKFRTRPGVVVSAKIARLNDSIVSARAPIRISAARRTFVEQRQNVKAEAASGDAMELETDSGATPGRAALREATTDGAPSMDGTDALPRRAWNVAPWIRAQMNRYEGEMAGTMHLLMQNGPRGWVGLDSVWEDNRTLLPPAEAAARKARATLEGVGYLSAASHRDLARALFSTGVFGEAADEIQKTLALQPDLVTKAQAEKYEAQRDSDPQILAVRQVENEVKISVAQNHPSYMIPALLNEWKSKPTTLCALRISLEYSRLAADSVASDWLEQAQDLESGSRQKVSDSDRMWINLLEEQLQNRRRIASKKPVNIIRSTLFTVRTNPNDLSATRLLAGLEAAQHTIYADFGIPMSNTEVVLWSNQRDFQRHTGQVSGTDTSEFVTALTLTQLVKTESGPEVLGEEINFYTDPRADSLPTIAHEYGHVAVRHLCRGREVPDWINEGVATVVEGGYEDYLPRVREAARKNRLLSMRELQAWQIDSADGERAFLAYSQANSLIDYIKARWGRAALLDLLRQIGQDRAPDDAVKIVLGETSEQLWSDWRREGIR